MREKLNIYTELHSQYVDQLVKLHQAHVSFVRKSNVHKTIALRTEIRNLRKILKAMSDIAPEVKLEHSQLYFEDPQYRKRKKYE